MRSKASSHGRQPTSLRSKVLPPDGPGLWGPEWFKPVPADQSLDIQAHGERLASNLLPGQFFYIFDFVQGGIVYMNPAVEQVLGYSPQQLTAEFLFGLIHPDDVQSALQGALLVNLYIREHPHEDLSRAVFTLDNRIRHANGHYVRLLWQQWITIRDPDGVMLQNASLCTDITVHKRTTDVQFSYSPPGFPEFVRRYLASQNTNNSSEIRLSDREKEVLALVVRGLTSRQIAYELKLTVPTVNTHRRNIKQKVGSHDLNELLRFL